MSRHPVNLQDSFLNQVRRGNHTVDIMLLAGTVLRGSVKGFDSFTVVLQCGPKQHLLYKHAIAQIVLSGEVDLHADGYCEGDAHMPANTMEFPAEAMEKRRTG